MEILAAVSDGNPEIEIDYDLARSQMSERYQIFSDAFGNISKSSGINGTLRRPTP